VEDNLKSVFFSHFWVSCNSLLCTLHVRKWIWSQPN